MTDHILYSFRRCPFAMRARLALAVSGVRYELREVRLSTKPPELLVMSPKGTVPVLVTAEGAVIEESLAIMRWALRIRDPQDWLARDDPALIATNDGVFKHHLDRYKYPDRHGSDAARHRDLGFAFLQDLETRIGLAGHLCGTEAGLTDAAVMPFVRQFAGVDWPWFDNLPLPRLKAWLAEHLASALFERIMYRVSPWSSGAKATIVEGMTAADG
ncbi:glutathione S-transferase [Sphingomonas sp. CFBP 8760]|uniref:glutathione S-transferase n=1 Tax=Sphingomonas sp. CFBP 8760 TaxID=2775282 RepID=UPI0017824650|nr:glutathione S-transferase [Sphingomonas sp. CFBP 8760]MBD8548431.1 glutathione S-transferase [Sphingomonas sp. CFBP 8760]